MVLTRNSLSNITNFEKPANFDVDNSDQENSQPQKVHRSTIKSGYEIGSSDTENSSAVSKRRSNASLPSCMFSRHSHRLIIPRGCSRDFFDENSIRSGIFSADEPPLRKKIKEEVKAIEETQHVSQFTLQDDCEINLGRTRQQTKRLNTETEEENPNVSSNDEEAKHARSYNLRAERRAPEFFQPNISSKKRSSQNQAPQYYAETLSSRVQRVPTSRNFHKKKRKTTKFHESDSTSSDSSDDEVRFKRRKKRSMNRSRLSFLPMNLTISDMTQSQRDRRTIGASLADVDPMNIDKTVTFAAIGGLANHIRSLKEMVLLPFLYPELFSKFNMNPPRGCLFYGPPGTGKTLMARALANECSKESGRKISFFMRKGADCLSKWVGESERQLRLLFDQAYIMRPSIIFFDEIDGLAPVRSSRQDQIHSSIVSTLLALMDGLDNRGEVIVIGATNRIDSLDPALRRPGRFDREFLFKLPDAKSRFEIVKIATCKWSPPMNAQMMQMVAERTHGYSGADLKMLCMEAALISTRRTFPQIYISEAKLNVDINAISVDVVDLFNAMNSIKVSTTRVVDCVSRPIDDNLKLLMGSEFKRIVDQIRGVFANDLLSSFGTEAAKNDLDSIVQDLIIPKSSGSLDFSSLAKYLPPGNVVHVCLTHVPLVDIVESIVVPAILNEYESFQVFVLSFSTIYGISGTSPEDVALSILKEASRASKGIICIPDAYKFYSAISDSVKGIIEENLERLISCKGRFLVITTLYSEQFRTLKEQCNDNLYVEQKWFGSSIEHHMEIFVPYPEKQCFENYFATIFNDLVYNSSLTKQNYPPLSTFSKAPEQPKESCARLTSSEIARVKEKHLAVMRELRIFLRDVLNRLARDIEHRCFLKPVDREEVNDYYDVVKNPMDLTTMMTKTDSGQYVSTKQFLDDINLIADNALEYNPVSDQQSLKVRHRACAFRDAAISMVTLEVDSEFEQQCEESLKSYNSLGMKPQTAAPKFFFTKSNRTSCSMKLRSKPGELTDPLVDVKPKPTGITKKTSLPKKKKNYCSKGIIMKYRKQRNHRQKTTPTCLNTTADASNVNNIGIKKLVACSPIKPRVTRSAAFQMKINEKSSDVALESKCDQSVKFTEESIPEVDESVEVEVNKKKGSKGSGDSTISSTISKKSTELNDDISSDKENRGRESNTCLVIGQFVPRSSKCREVDSPVPMDESCVESRNEAARSKEYLVLTDSMFEGCGVSSCKDESDPNQLFLVHHSTTNNELDEENTFFVNECADAVNKSDGLVPHSISPETSQHSTDVPVENFAETLSEAASCLKLKQTNARLLERCVSMTFDYTLSVRETINLYSNLRQIIYNHRFDCSPEKTEMYQDIKTLLSCSDIQ